MAPQSTQLSPSELAYLHSSLSSHPPIRPDSRLATDFRPLNAETGVLPSTMGSSHVGFADGREAVVGVRAELEKEKTKTTTTATAMVTGMRTLGDAMNQDVQMGGVDAAGDQTGELRGRAEWVTLSLTLPGLRDDDKDLVFLEEMLREVIVSAKTMSSLSDTREMPGATSLPNALVINTRWHWHLYIDVLLISPPDAASSSSSSTSAAGSGNYPLPLLSMAVHLALRDTKIPRLKSEAEEDPVADDDWNAALPLYERSRGTGGSHVSIPGLMMSGLTPPVTLLVMVVGENIIFDPAGTELAVADGIWAVSFGRTTPTGFTDTMGGGGGGAGAGSSSSTIRILGLRTLETPARDTMKGVAREIGPSDPSTVSSNANTLSGLRSGTDETVPGVWKPKVGGTKRAVVMQVIKAVVGPDGAGVGKEVLMSLDGFVRTGV